MPSASRDQTGRSQLARPWSSRPSYVSRRPVYTLSNLEIATVNRNLAVRTALSSLPSLWPLRAERRGGSASAPRVACDTEAAVGAGALGGCHVGLLHAWCDDAVSIY